MFQPDISVLHGVEPQAIQQARAKESGKPAEIAAKMAEGALQRSRANIALAITGFADKGDEDAFSEIVRRYAGVVFCACHRVLRDRGWAEDVAQEVFLQVWQTAARFEQRYPGSVHLEKIRGQR